MSENALQKIEPMPMAAVEPTTPHALMRRATDVAGVCREIVLKTACEIQGRKFVKVEGWESIATAHGCFVGAEDAKRAYDKEGNHIGYEARSVMRNSHGDIIATGEGFVGFDEKDRKGNATWKNRAEYAGRAMAQTRSISRVCRSVFAHVVVLIDAGLSTTPAEEVPEGGFDDNERATRAKPAKVPHGTPTTTAQKRDTELKQATEKTREWFLSEMRKRFDEQVLLQFFIDRNPAYILPNETLEDIHLDRVPTTRQALDEMVAECSGFMGMEPRSVGEGTQNALKPSESDSDRADARAGDQNAPEGDSERSEGATDDGVETITGKLEAVSVKEGRSGKGPWKRFGVKVCEEWFGTFNSTLGELAKKDKGHTVTIHFKREERGNELIGIERARNPPNGQAHTPRAHEP